MSDIVARQSEDGSWYVMQYRHTDCTVEPGVEWEDDWDCACNSECPACGMKDIEPFSVEDVEP